MPAGGCTALPEQEGPLLPPNPPHPPVLARLHALLLCPQVLTLRFLSHNASPVSPPPPALPLCSQVSALRFLSQKGLSNCDFLVGTTAMCTGGTLLAGLLADGVAAAGTAEA